MSRRENGLPADIYAERIVLGSALLKGGNLDLIAASLEPADFLLEKHRLIFQRMLDLRSDGKDVDRVTLASHLMTTGELQQVDGISYLAELDNGLPEIYHLDSYIRIIQEKAALRRVIYAAREATEKALAGQTPATQIATAFDEQIRRAVADRIGNPIQRAERIVLDYPGGLEAFLKRTRRRGISTGLSDLDRMTNGWKPGELHVIAARPGVGKTSLAMDIATHVATAENLPVVFVSLEMTKENLLERATCSRARIDLGRFARGELTREELIKASRALGEICSAPLYIDDTPVQSIPLLLSRLRLLKAQEGQIGLIVIDYLQLMQEDRYAGNRVQEVSAVSRGAKLIAKDMGCPVLALSQMSRAVESRDDKRPRLSDLRESGAIEQDADTVMFIHRPELYEPERAELAGMAELIVAKHRNGPLGTIHLRFDGRYTRFYQLERGDGFPE